MAETLGIQFSIGAKIDELQKALNDAKKAIAEVAKESEKQADGIGDPLKKVADQIGSKYGWLAGELATRLAGLVNPAALASAAIAALGAAVIAYIESSKEKVFTLDEVMKRHAETIKGIGKAYPEAIEGLKQFAAESGQMLETRLRGDLMRTQEQIKKLSEEFVNAVANPAARSGIELLIQKIGGLKEGVMIVKNEFEMFRAPILEFNKSIRDGKPDVDALKRSLDAIPNTTPEVIKLKNEIIDLLDKGLNRASGEAKIMEAALSRLGAEMNGTAAATRVFNDAMKTLQGIEPKQIDDMTRANNALSEAMKNQNLTEQQRIALQNEHAAAAGRVNEAAAAVAAEEAKRLAEAAAREAEYFKQREENEKLFLQNGLNNLTLSWGTREEQLAAHLTREQELIQQARDKEVIDDQTHKALMERSEQEYQSRIAQLRAMNNITALKDLGTFFKGAEALAKSNGDKSFKTAKAFAIATGVLSTVSAAIQAMNDPTAITPFQKFANYAAVLGKGLSAVASIRGMSPSGGGGGGGSSGASGSSGGTPEGASSPSSRMGQSVFINLQGQSFGRDQVRDLVKQIADFQKDGGQVVFG
jgi:hypothetical protein